MFITTILFLTNFSYSSEFFELNGKTYELNEIDIRKEIGCDSKFYEYIVVGIKDTKSNELVWSWPEFKEVREYWKKNKECGGSGFHTYKIKHLWNRSGFVDFIVVGQDCGASCTPHSVTILRFDGHKVTKIKQFSADGLELDIERDKMVAIFKIYEGQCRPCPHRWTRVTYKWDGNTYKKIKSEETQEESNTSPW